MSQYQELLAKQRELQQELDKLRAEVNPVIVAQIKTMMKDYDIKPHEIAAPDGRVRRVRRTKAEMAAARQQSVADAT